MFVLIAIDPGASRNVPVIPRIWTNLPGALLVGSRVWAWCRFGLLFRLRRIVIVDDDLGRRLGAGSAGGQSGSKASEFDIIVSGK